MEEKTPKKRGRKSKRDYLLSKKDEIKKLASQGYSEKEIIKHLGIAQSTYFKYKSEILELSECIKDGREKAIEELEKITYKTAMGYEYTEEKMVIQLDEEGNPAKRVKEVYTKYQPPNPAQQQYLLNNWTKGKYTKDPLVAKFREEELKLKQESAKYEDW